MDKTKIIGSHKKHCTGALGSHDAPYVTAPILAIGSSPMFGIEKPCEVERICSFDAAETENTYIGQTNAIIVSSFCGPHGSVWGLDLASAKGLEQAHPLLPHPMELEGENIPIYSAEPLLNAAERLFGTVDARRFPLYPGTHLPAALKTSYAEGPNHLFTMLAIGIPQDPTKNARLFMEDVGVIDEELTDERRARMLSHLSRSVVRVAKQQRVPLKAIYIGLRDRFIEEGNMGCALASIPYFILAKDAVPDQDATILQNISLDDWEEKTQENFLNTE